MFYIIIDLRNGHVMTTEADTLAGAQQMAEAHCAPEAKGWMATVLDNNGKQIGIYRWGAVVANRGWQ